MKHKLIKALMAIMVIVLTYSLFALTELRVSLFVMTFIALVLTCSVFWWAHQVKG